MKTLNGKLVNFFATDKLPLQGFVSQSKQHNKKIIIHLHGMTGTFESSPLQWEIARQLNNGDYDIFLIKTRGSGLKTRFYKGNKKVQLGTAFEKFEDCIKDISGAIDAAKKLGYNEVILSGHSTGCQKIVYYQSKEQDKIVKALLLLGAGDDYSLAKLKHGKYFGYTVKLAKSLVKKKRGNEVRAEFGEYCASRYLSYADPQSAEGELFNYFGELKQFSKIKEPILAVFGSKDHTAIEGARKALAKLREKTNSSFLITAQIKGANHSFVGKEKETANLIKLFLNELK